MSNELNGKILEATSKKYVVATNADYPNFTDGRKWVKYSDGTFTMQIQVSTTRACTTAWNGMYLDGDGYTFGLPFTPVSYYVSGSNVATENLGGHLGIGTNSDSIIVYAWNRISAANCYVSYDIELKGRWK